MKQLKVWELLKSEELFVAKPWLSVSVQTLRLPDGRIIDDYYRVEFPEYAAVVAQIPDGRVIMERQYRQGVGKVTLVLPGGGIEKDEDPLEAAKRELREETGYTAQSWQSLGSFIKDANHGGGKAHLFAAKHAQQVTQPHSGDLEETEIVLMYPEEIIRAVHQGEVVLLGVVAAIALALDPKFTSKE